MNPNRVLRVAALALAMVGGGAGSGDRSAVGRAAWEDLRRCQGKPEATRAANRGNHIARDSGGAGRRPALGASRFPGAGAADVNVEGVGELAFSALSVPYLAAAAALVALGVRVWASGICFALCVM